MLLYFETLLDIVSRGLDAYDWSYTSTIYYMLQFTFERMHYRNGYYGN